MLIACVLLCDRKFYHWKPTFQVLRKNASVDRIYVNIQTSNPDLYRPLEDFLKRTGKPFHIDYWDIQSSWLRKPAYDQDQIRLIPIVLARNLCIDYCLSRNADHLLFVDSDIEPHSGAIEYLIAAKSNLCGGYVAGRGAHSHFYYVFGSRRGIVQTGNVIECDHGTCGLMLIHRNTFSRLRFRWGADPDDPTQLLSEDPAYCADWYQISGERFYIDIRATATHHDNPARPLVDDETARDSWETLQD